MHTFQINALIRFVMSSTCFEPHGFFVRKTICTCSFCMVCFSHMYKLSSWWWTHEVSNMYKMSKIELKH